MEFLAIIGGIAIAAVSIIGIVTIVISLDDKFMSNK